MQLEYFKAKSILDRYGIGSIDSRYVGNAASAVKFASGKPIVLKVISDKAIHKSKAGLVRAQLTGSDEITGAYAELERKARPLAPYRIIAQKMAGQGVEIILGGREDPQFGKLVLLGLGGIYVEAFKDFALRVCPITEYDARDMIQQLRSRDVITHGGKAGPLLEQLLMKTSKLLHGSREIKELDLNPVIIRADGYDVVDIRVLV
jgi:succinyl-CoA synthetase beta subunit